MPTGIYIRKPMPDDVRAKISDTMKKIGHKPPSRLGRHPSEESKTKNRLSNLGKTRSDETKRRMSITRKGVPMPMITRQKIKDYWSNHKSINCINKTTTEYNRARQSGEYKFWRKECLKRDNFTCQITGQTGGKLEVHHLNNFAEFPELRCDIDNGITLSKEIHKEFHHKYGTRHNTKEQLIEFINSY